MQLIADHAIHGWDLAVATGGDTAIDDELVAALTGWFVEREDLYRGAGAVAERPPVSARNAQEELLVAFGRDPAWGAAHDVVRRFGAAWEAWDLEAIMALMADDAVFESTGPAPDGRRIEGAAAIRAEWEAMFRDTRDASFTFEEAFVLGRPGDRAVGVRLDERRRVARSCPRRRRHPGARRADRREALLRQGLTRGPLGRPGANGARRRGRATAAAGPGGRGRPRRIGAGPAGLRSLVRAVTTAISAASSSAVGSPRTTRSNGPSLVHASRITGSCRNRRAAAATGVHAWCGDASPT